jgi:hypothetical protein
MKSALFVLCFGLLELLASGCTNLPSDVTLEGAGPQQGLQTQTATCSTLVELDRDLSGSGPVSITVTDGAGHTVYFNDDDVTGNIDDTSNLTGLTGTWTITLDASAFDGSYNVELSCP